MKTAILILITLLKTAGAADSTCDLSNAALMRYESRVLAAAGEFEKSHTSAHLLKIAEPLGCILQIHETSNGELKSFANSFLTPLLGGPQINGVPKDPRYKIVASELAKASSHSVNLLENSVMASHSRGTWGFYTLFCEKGNVEFCTEFLPSNPQILVESPLLAASSMILLRKAYYTLKGKQKDEVAARIKELYRTTPQDRLLERRVIEQIYSELFTSPSPLSLLS